jgi:hypothetical protein
VIATAEAPDASPRRVRSPTRTMAVSRRIARG